jgi:hypothetical protein
MSQASPPLSRRAIAAIAIASGAVTIAVVVSIAAVTGYLRPRDAAPAPAPDVQAAQIMQPVAPAAEAAPAEAAPAADLAPATIDEPTIVYTMDPPRRGDHDDRGRDHDRDRDDDDE